jgi:putative membrane protein
MTLEALLAFLHISAFLALVVFLTSETALCRPEWFNATIVERLVIVDRIYGIAAIAVLLTGLARIFLGMKGAGWYASNWLLWTKVGLFVAVGLMSIRPTLRFLVWRRALRADGSLPSAEEVRAVRRWVMWQAHIVPFIPLPAVFLARGWGHVG